MAPGVWWRMVVSNTPLTEVGLFELERALAEEVIVQVFSEAVLVLQLDHVPVYRGGQVVPNHADEAVQSLLLEPDEPHAVAQQRHGSEVVLGARVRGGRGHGRERKAGAE